MRWGVGDEWDRVLYDSWCKGYNSGAGCGRCGGDKDLRDVVAGDWSFPVGEEVHYRVVDDCVGEWVAADIAAAGVPLEELDVGDKYAAPVSAGEEAVAVGHVDQGAAFDTVLVAHVESDVVFHVELLNTFVVLEWEAQ